MSAEMLTSARLKISLEAARALAPRASNIHGKGTITEIARLEAAAGSHRGDLEHERKRVDHLMAELLKATASMAAKEATARLDGELATLLAVGAGTSHGQARSPIRHLAATLMQADRRACK